MLLKLKTAFGNTKISNKLLITFIGLSICSSLILSLFLYQYFYHLFYSQAQKETELSLNTINALIGDLEKGLFQGVATFTSQSEFIEICTDVANNNASDFANNYNNIQSHIDTLLRSNDMIESVFVVGKNGELYSHMTDGQRYHAELTSVYQNQHLDGITYLTSMQNPVPYQSALVLPVIFPISTLHANTIQISNSDSAVVSVIIHLDTDKITALLSSFNKNVDTQIYLADINGIPLTPIANDTSLSQVISSNTLQTALANTPQLTNHSLTLPLNSKEMICEITARTTNSNNLKLVSIVDQKKFLSQMKPLKIFTMISICVNILISLVICYYLSKTLSNPLSKLNNYVQQLGENHYTPSRFPKYSDEIGSLTQSINHMCLLIQKQIDEIRYESEQRHKAQTTVLINQINPHFLFNTLEFIHWEILNHNKESAASMVESLGDFFRYSLKLQESMTSLRDELSHAQAYINIINLRTGQPITLTIQCDENLWPSKVVRFILQPCIENCIQHGFKEQTTIFPQIDIQVLIHNNYIQLSISDNGIGFDTEQVQSTIALPPTDTHIGLRNIYQRLTLTYGNDFSLTLESLPYYKNTITFTYPLSP